jgi:hypothetical protein
MMICEPRFLPEPVVILLRERSGGGAAATLTVLDTVCEHPELIWTAEMQGELRAAISALLLAHLTCAGSSSSSSSSSGGKNSPLPSALPATPASEDALALPLHRQFSVPPRLPVDYSVRYRQTAAEIFIGGVYIRLFLKQPTFRLSNPMLFLEKLVEFWECAFSIQVPIKPQKEQSGTSNSSGVGGAAAAANAGGSSGVGAGAGRSAAAAILAPTVAPGSGSSALTVVGGSSSNSAGSHGFHSGSSGSSRGRGSDTAGGGSSSGGSGGNDLETSRALVLGSEDFLGLLTSCIVCTVKGEPSVVDHLLSWGVIQNCAALLKRAVQQGKRGAPMVSIVRVLLQVVHRVEAVESLVSATVDAVEQLSLCIILGDTLPVDVTVVTELLKKIYQCTYNRYLSSCITTALKMNLCGALLGRILGVPVTSLSHVRNPDALRIHAVDLIKAVLAACEMLDGGAALQLRSQLDKHPAWRAYKGQSHDLFIRVTQVISCRIISYHVVSCLLVDYFYFYFSSSFSLLRLLLLRTLLVLSHQLILIVTLFFYISQCIARTRRRWTTTCWRTPRAPSTPACSPTAQALALLLALVLALALALALAPVLLLPLVVLPLVLALMQLLRSPTMLLLRLCPASAWVRFSPHH